MALVYPYKRLAAPAPILSLGGLLYRPKSIITATLIGPGGSLLRNCLVDSGADDTVLPDSFAASLGIDLFSAPTGSASGIGLAVSTLRFARVTFRLASALTTERRQWDAWVGFTPTALRWPLLGYAGFLQFFTATFHGDLERLELAVNATYPGT